MKKIVFGVILPVAAAVLLGAPYYFGIKAQESLTEQHRILKDTFFFDVVSHQYDRGWFSATETTVIRFHPALLSQFAKQLPENLKTVLDKDITIINHVKHGLFADGITPVRASIHTEFRYTPEVQKILSRFFNDKTPLSMTNTIGLGGGGVLDIKIAPFDYEELSGIKLNWKGMNAQVDYQSGFSRYETVMDIPGLEAVLADKGNISLEGIHSRALTRSGSHGVSLGNADIQLKRFDVRWKDQIDYNIRLNDLVNAVTDLQIGAFINPTGSIAPSSISVHNLGYSSQTDEKDGFINSRGRFTFDKLHYGEDQYGPLDIDIAAEHLHAQSFGAVKALWQKLSTDSSLSGEQIQDKVLASLRNEGAGLFTNNPVFKINKFDLTAPSGHIRVNGNILFNGLQAAELNDFSAMVKKLQAQLKFDLSEKVLQTFAVSQARNLLATDTPEDEQAQKDVDETVRLIMDGTIKGLVQDGYLTQADGSLQTELVLENNQIRLNGKAYSVQSDEELFQELEADSPPPAKLPADEPAASAP